MSSLDDFYDDNDEENPDEAGGAAGEAMSAGEPAPVGFRDWLSARRGALIIAGLAVSQALFAVIVIQLRADAKPRREVEERIIRDLAVEMLGHEIAVGQIYQMVPARGGKRMTIGLDLVLILGQLPEERLADAEKPNADEFELFKTAVREMEPAIRSQVNLLLQKIPRDELGTAEGQKRIKDEVGNHINDLLEGIDFGGGVRKGIAKRRVTDVLLPMFVRQYL